MIGLRALFGSVSAVIIAVSLSAPASADAPSVQGSPAPSVSTVQGTTSLFAATATPCAADVSGIAESDPDVVIRPDANLRVAFHGNRFVLAHAIVRAFEQAHPGARVSYTALPPAFSLAALTKGAADIGGKSFRPDVYMGPSHLAMASPLMPDASPALRPMGLYSRVHGLMLVMRADINPAAHSATWQGLLGDRTLRLVVPGEQHLSFTLFDPLREVLGDSGLLALRGSPAVDVSFIRHHRSIPARLAAGCAQLGVQFLQSRSHLESLYPGAFRFLPIPISPSTAKKEESYLYIDRRTPSPELAQAFAEFMLSDVALDILRTHNLQP